MMRWAWKLNGVPRLGWYLWPGLAPLWLRGSWTGLACAVFFALLLNITLATSFVWSGMIGPSLRGGLWTTVALGWLAGAVATRYWRWWPIDETELDEAEGLFPDALGEYLRGNWMEAEKLIARILRSRPDDVQARLLWTSVLRRTGRTDEARRRLGELSRLETAHDWQWEIETELEQLEQGRKPPEEPPAGDAQGSPAVDHSDNNTQNEAA